MKTDLRQVRESLIRLRNDAIARQMDDLTLVYGWSAISLGIELLKVYGVSQQRDESN